MKVEDLAKSAVVSIRTIGRLESEDDRPETCRQETVDDLARALSDAPTKPGAIQCKPGHLFFFRLSDGTLQDLEPDDPTVPKKPVPKPAARTPGLDAELAPAPAKKRTITQFAATERQLGLHDQRVKLDGRELPLLGAHYLQRVEAEYVDFERKHFAIRGTVEDCRPIPPIAIDALKAERGRGGRLFKVSRMVEGVGADGDPKEFEVYATIFAPDAALSAELFRCHENGIAVTIDAHIYVALARDEWKGFFHYEGPRSRPSPKEWALVAAAVYPESVATPVRATGGR